jgi:hypothetical protein
MQFMDSTKVAFIFSCLCFFFLIYKLNFLNVIYKFQKIAFPFSEFGSLAICP